MSATKAEGTKAAAAAPGKSTPAAAGAAAKIAPKEGSGEKKKGAPAAAGEKNAVAVAVHPYKRSDGTPVSKHTRRPPGVAQKEEQKKEQKKAFFEQKKQEREKAKREREKSKSEPKDEGDWEEQDEEDEAGLEHDDEEQEEEEEDETKRARTEGEGEEGDEGQEGGGGGDNNAEGEEQQPATAGQKIRPISLDEYLSMPWSAQQQILVDKKLDQTDRRGNKDAVARHLVVKDAIAAAEKSGAAAFQDNLEDGRILGYDDFLRAFDKAGNFNNPDRAAVSRHLRSGKYNDGGEFGKTCLVPHLHGVGMFELAKAVQVGKYKF